MKKLIFKLFINRLFFISILSFPLLIDAQNLNHSLQVKNQTSYPFEENKGQISGEDVKKVKFTYKIGNTSVYLMDDGISYQFNRVHYPQNYKHLSKFSSPEEIKRIKTLNKNIRIETYRMNIELLGVNSNIKVITEGKSKDYINYYSHNTLEVHSYKKVTYKNVYDGIDWVIYTNNNSLKYDFIVHPGANPSLIKLKPKWVESLNLNKDGSLSLNNRMGSIREEKPISYQGKNKINTNFVLKEGIISFKLDVYNPDETLTIDPLVRFWATYYGGTAYDVGFSSSIDSSNNIYLAGYTQSNSNLASGGYQNTYGGGNQDAFLVKFNKDGIRQWATYYGGNDFDAAYSCEIDISSNIYLSGTTGSNSNIASSGFQNISGGNFDAYLVKFDSNGFRQWATYYGGNSNEFSSFCSADKKGNIYLAGETSSTSNISSSGYQNTYGGGNRDAFIVKFNSNGVRQWATYHGGNNDDYSTSCTVDYFGNIYFAGGTHSPNNIASGGYQNTHGGTGSPDAFLVKMDSSGNLDWATYYGGNQHDIAHSCITDVAGNVYIAGNTLSPSDIASGGYQNILNGISDGFLAKFNSMGVRLWATYYGGIGLERVNTCSADDLGNVLITGQTSSFSGISHLGFQSMHGGGLDAYLIQFDSSGARQWGTYYGGSMDDIGNTCVRDKLGNIYLAGETNSNSDIAFGGHQITFSGGMNDAFLVKLKYDSVSEIKNISHNNEIIIYPNPNNGTFKIDYQGRSTIEKIKIYNAMGQVVLKQKELMVNTSLTPGIYFIDLTTKNKEQIIEKVIIQ